MTIQVTFESPWVVVLDNLLSPDEWHGIAEFLSQEPHEEPGDEWPISREGGGKPREGRVVISRSPSRSLVSESLQCYPTGTPMDHLVRRLLSLAGILKPWIGARGTSWDLFTLRGFEYPGGSDLTWHVDANGRSGAFSYYIHPFWRLEWGGALLITEAASEALDRVLEPSSTSEPSAGAMVLERLVADNGIGYFVSPKPNRLVVMKSGVLHRVDRVRAAVVRRSVSGFFLHAREGQNPGVGDA